MAEWDIPPRVKVLEAMGAVADGRVEVKNHKGKVTSSMETKKYTVVYEEKRNAVYSNDNASKWQGYMGYPTIAFLMEKGMIGYDKKVAQAMKGFRWKKLNEKFDDHSETALYVKQECSLKPEDIEGAVDAVMRRLRELGLKKAWRDIEVERLD